jgi:uncharacterized LabA/DUF88 family protein
MRKKGLHLAQERLNIAVFIDFDNIEIGVRTTLHEHFDVGTVLEAVKERGEVVTKIAYADWTRAGEYSRALTQHAIRLVQRNLTPGGDKNGADINLALDALEMAFTHPHINAYVIVGGDSDFLSLVEKLKQYDKKVFVVGGRQFTSVILQRNCHEFVAYENLVRPRRSQVAGKDTRPATPAASAPVAQAVPLVRRALKILADREVTPQTGLLKSTLLQLDSTFSERSYGASSFLDFAEKLASAGLVTLKHNGRSVTVELNEGFSEAEMAEGTPEGAPQVAAQQPAPDAQARPPVEATESQADGVRLVGEILGASVNARWPMYVRNLKQILRQADRGFDERRFGFAGLMDLVRACQRENLLRVERDRRGGLRVFPGASLQRQGPAPSAQGVEGNVAETIEFPEALSEPVTDLDLDEAPQPDLVDTTAELLGRAKARPRRPRAAAVTATRKAAKPRKPATRRAAKTKKTPSEDGDGNR